MIRGLWARGTDWIIDARIVRMYWCQVQTVGQNILAATKHEKKKKYLEANVGSFLRLWYLRMVC